MDFETIFISEDFPYKGQSRRDKFLSRIFGIFNEEIVRIWSMNDRSPLTDLGRPTIYDHDGKYYTLDFLFQDDNGQLFVTEMKCELEYQKYRYLTLQDPQQLDHHKNKRAFQLLLELAKNPHGYVIKRQGEVVEVDGTGLVWGRATPEGISASKNHYGFDHILSVESIVEDLIDWQDQQYCEFIEQYRKWSHELFDGLQLK